MIQPPKMMSIRAIAETGLLTEHALRQLLKSGRLPAIFVGKKAHVNYDALLAQLENLQGNIAEK